MYKKSIVQKALRTNDLLWSQCTISRSSIFIYIIEMVTAVVAVLKFSDNFIHFFAPHVRPRKSRKLFRSGFYDVDEIIGPRPEP